MRWSFRIGSLFGIPIKVHFTFILLLIFIALSPRKDAGTLTGLIGVITVILIFACVLIHELVHSIIAKALKIDVKDIILLPIGGVSSIKDLSKDPNNEIWIAIGGPIISGVLSFIFYFMAKVITPHSSMDFAHGNLLVTLFWVNLILALFNIIPAFPMDGGRVLRGILARKMDHLRATRIAVSIGRYFAILLFFVGIFYNWWMALIAVFLYLGGESEARMEQMQLSLANVPVKKAMITNIMAFPSNLTIKNAIEQIYHTSQVDFPVVKRGVVEGIVSRDRLVSAVKEKKEGLYVKDIMEKDFIAFNENTPLSEVFKDMVENSISSAPIISGNRIIGMITLDQIAKYKMLKQVKNSLH